MKDTSFSDAMGQISERHIHEALAIDGKEALDKARQAEQRRPGGLLRRFALPVAACLSAVLAVGLLIRMGRSGTIDPAPVDTEPETVQTEPVLGADPGENSNGEVQIPNPMQDLGSPEAVGEAMGHAFPVLPGRTPETCTVIQYGPVPALGRVSYTDGTELAIGPAGEDISGIYGGELVETFPVEDISISIFTYEDQPYALWDQDGFAWCWYAAEGENTASVEGAVQEVVSAIPG